MPNFGEHNPVQARNIEYAEVIGWAVVPREEVEERHGKPFFRTLLHERMTTKTFLNPRDCELMS